MVTMDPISIRPVTVDLPILVTLSRLGVTTTAKDCDNERFLLFWKEKAASLQPTNLLLLLYLL